MNLKSIIYAITPENIRSIPLVRVSMDIFIEYLMKSNEVSQRVTALFDVEDEPNLTKSQLDAKKIMRKGMYCTWIYSLYNVINKARYSIPVMKSLEKNGYGNSLLYKEIDKILTNEIINTQRIFNFKVGTTNALKYMYYFGKYLETGDYSLDLKIKEIGPFNMHYEGSMSPELFDTVIRPLAHPIGWIDGYMRLINNALHDYFGIQINTSYNKIELNYGNRWVVFTADTNKDSTVEDFTQRVNPQTGKFYTTYEIATLVEVYTGKVVSSFDKTVNDDGSIDRVIVFNDDTVLLTKGASPSWIKLTTYEDYINGVKEPTRTWGSKWSFLGDITSNYEFTYTDKMDSIGMEFDFDGTDDNGNPIQPLPPDIDPNQPLGPDNGEYYKGTTYITVYPENCFKVGGTEYPYTFGNDEQQYRVTNSANVKDVIMSNFTTKVAYRVFRSATITLTDDYENVQKWYVHYPNPDKAKFGELTFSTWGMGGFNYRVDIHEIGGQDYWYRASGLNQQNPAIVIEKVFTENHLLRLWGTAHLKAPWNKWNEKQSLSIIIHDKNQNHQTVKTEKDGKFYFEVDIGKLSAGAFRVDFTVVNDYGRVRHSAFYEGKDLWAYCDIEPYVTLLQYKNATPVPKIEHEKLQHISLLEGTYSTAPYVKYRIGQFRNKTYDVADSRVIDYTDVTNPVQPWDNPELDDKIIRGAFVEGNYFHKSYWWNDKYKDEEMFIYKGFAHFAIDVPDNYILDTQRTATDDVDIRSMSAKSKGLYLVTQPQYFDTVGKYLYSTDGCYLYSKEWYITITLDKHNTDVPEDKVFDRNIRWLYIKDTIPAPEKYGYIFSHWSLTNYGDEIDDRFVFNKHTTIHAVYVESKPTITITTMTTPQQQITFNIDISGDVIHPDGSDRKVVRWPEVEPKLHVPHKEPVNGVSYEFKYWSLSDGGQAIDDTVVFRKDTNIWPMFREVEALNDVTLHVRDSTTVVNVSTLLSFEELLPVLADACDLSDVETDDGKLVFKHWSFVPGGVAVESSYHVGSNVDIWAVYDKIMKYTVRFDTLGGEFIPKMTVCGSLDTLDIPTPTNGSRVFVGWSEIPGGGGGLGSSLVDMSAIVDHDMRLYAVWA